MSYRTLLATGPLLALGLFGCSGTRPAVDMIEVTGRVTLKGQPVERVILNLTPVTPGEGREDDCVVERGEFRKKLISARYKVWFTQCPGGPGVPARYQNPDASQLTLDGTKSEAVTFDLKQSP